MRWSGLRDYKLYLNDIIDAVKKIQDYVKDHDEKSFLEDSKTFDSVLHNFVVIGEAASKIPEKIKDKNPDVNWSGIIGMRNIIVHGYFTIDPNIIWSTIKTRLPELLEQIKEL